MNWLLSLALVFTSSYAPAQRPPTVFRLDSLPAQGVLLDRGWRFYPGDNPNYAQPGLDDRQWAPIDPTRAIQDLPPVQRAGISWLRLHVTTGQDLPPVLVYVFQSVASEVYLDGRLLYRFGTISPNPDSVRAYNPYAAFSLPLRPATPHVLAVRIAYQPGIDYQKSYVGRLPSVVRLNLFPAAEIPAIPLFNIESVYLDTFKIGICFILLVLHLSLFIANRRQLANGYAAGMYLLMGLQFLLRAAYDLMHGVEARMVLHYYLLLSPWISGLMVLIFYSLFGLRRSWAFWLVISSIVLMAFPLPKEYPWLTIVLSYYMSLELIRISVGATKRNVLGARIVAIGVVCNAGLDMVHVIINTYNVPVIGHEWLFHLLFNFSFLCIPLALSLRLSLEHGWVSRQLSIKLQEVEDLSARNMDQQQHRQQLLARQNEQLEQQVEARTKELQQQAKQLRELDAVKSRFVTNLTHEFRTPLALIISPVAKLLESSVLSREVQVPLRTVERNARHLLNQVNQLLDVARLEDGRMSLTLQPVKLGQFTAQLVDLFNSPAEADQITLMLRTQGDDSLYLMDTDKWGKIVYNLLANALKFTPAGGRVGVELVLEGGQVQFTVNDTGIGIAADKLPFIFDRFYQADDATNRSFEGTGVGLALVRELTNLLGGSVVAGSQPGVGSTFTVRLPMQAAPSASPVAADGARPPVAVLPPGATGRRALAEETAPPAGQDDPAFVLIVEDNAELRQFMADELSTRYRVLTAPNGQQGWALTQEHLPDVVISDVMMPQMDGFQLTNLIKNGAATEHIAVVLLTARSGHENRLEGLQKGADEYLVKPFDLAELRLRLANLITRQQKLQAHYRQQLTQPTANGEVTPTLLADPFLDRIYSLLEAHLDDPAVGVDWLADQVAMDRKTLYRKLQSKLQLSPNALIRTYRLRRGGQLLRLGKTVTETAYSVGFESVTYFGHCFKEQYQMTPTEYINRTN